MIALAGAAIVLPDRVLDDGAVLIEGDRIVDVGTRLRTAGAERTVALGGDYVLPGFIDVHVHGVAGVDALESEDAVARMAERLPRYGVTAFCPTSVACDPATLARLLDGVRRARLRRDVPAARVLGAHLESNFINPEWAGAQPVACVRRPPGSAGSRRAPGEPEGFTADEILAVMEDGAADVRIVTLAPELDGALDLVRCFAARGHRVSLGHSGATYEQALEAIGAGARQATHLFNRMRPMTHRDPGLVGAALRSEEIIAELVCDGHHVHPAVAHVAVAAKSPSGVMAITDGTAGSGLPPGTRAVLAGRAITVGATARYDDGTMAGSVATMDRAFAWLVSGVGLSLVDAVRLCATTPARALGLDGRGVVAPGAAADLVVMDASLRVRATYIGGVLAYAAGDRG